MAYFAVPTMRRRCGATALLAALALMMASATAFTSFASPPRGVSAASAVRSAAWAPRLAEGSGVALMPMAGAGLVGAAILCRALQKPAKRSQPRTARQALTEVGSVKLNLMAGKATPAPPVGPALGEFGANIAFFVKEYNALTADKVGEVIPVVVHVMSDRSFTLELKTPPTPALLHKAVGKDRGSGMAQDIIGTISIDKLREIAELKLPDLNCAESVLPSARVQRSSGATFKTLNGFSLTEHIRDVTVPNRRQDITRAMKIIHGTAVASGVKVEGYDEWLAQQFKPPASILERYGPGLENLPKAPGDAQGDGAAVESDASAESDAAPADSATPDTPLA